VRDGRRRLRAVMWAVVATGIIASLSPRVAIPSLSAASASKDVGATRAGPGPRVSGQRGGTFAPSAASRSDQPGQVRQAGKPSSAGAGSQFGPAQASAAEEAGTFIPVPSGSAATVPTAQLTARIRPVVAPLGRLLAADLLVVAPATLPRKVLAGVSRLHGVVAAQLVDAARIRLNGGYVAMLGVNPSKFRAFAARPTAESTALWQNVAAGGIAVSYLMGKQERLPLGGTVRVEGRQTEQLRVGGFGTVGISGVDAVVSDQVARSLGMPGGNAIVISAPHARLGALVTEVAALLPRDASVAPLVAQPAVRGLPVTTGSAGGLGVTAADGPGLTWQQTRAFLAAAVSRVGLPYVWGGSGPDVFDCSGLVQWSMRQAGIVMPRVAVDQAQTGPLISLADLQPGDLLFYHTDPTAPNYISHVAIYLGDGKMLQAPEPGMDVQVVPAVFDGGFAGAVAVYPRVAAAVAGELASG
jgi:peptidoglycan DL-endopeptidase CwlO